VRQQRGQKLLQKRQEPVPVQQQEPVREQQRVLVRVRALLPSCRKRKERQQRQ